MELRFNRALWLSCIMTLVWRHTLNTRRCYAKAFTEITSARSDFKMRVPDSNIPTKCAYLSCMLNRNFEHWITVYYIITMAVKTDFPKTIFVAAKLYHYFLALDKKWLAFYPRSFCAICVTCGTAFYSNALYWKSVDMSIVIEPM